MKPFASCFLAVFMLAALCACLNGGAQARPTPDAKRPASAVTVSFHRDVLPIFRTACVGCHGSDNPASGLVLTSYADLMKGGRGGVEIVAGKSGDSRLFKYLTGALQPRMPPGSGLKQIDIDRVRQWIDAGAKFDAPINEAGGKTAARSKLANGGMRTAAAGSAATTRPLLNVRRR